MLSGLPLSLALTGLSGAGALTRGGAREQIEEAARLGYRAVQLDGAMGGVRARELDRSARRDLAAFLRRLNLALSGIDLWVPPAHFTDAAHSDRAVNAVEQAADLAGELSSLAASTPASGRAVCCTLPSDCPAPIVSHLASACEARGVTLADHAWPVRAPAAGAIGLGVDPGAIIFAGHDPAIEVARLRSSPVSARLTDMSASGRVEPGSGLGGLDRAAYEAALHVRGYRGHLVFDLRGLADIPAAARRLSPSRTVV